MSVSMCSLIGTSATRTIQVWIWPLGGFCCPLNVTYSVKKDSPSSLLAAGWVMLGEEVAGSLRGGLPCHCLHGGCVGLLAAQLSLLLGLRWTPSSRPPQRRPVFCLPVTTWPVHLSCVRNARCLEGGWRQGEETFLLWIILLGLNYW